MSLANPIGDSSQSGATNSALNRPHTTTFGPMPQFVQNPQVMMTLLNALTQILDQFAQMFGQGGGEPQGNRGCVGPQGGSAGPAGAGAGAGQNAGPSGGRDSADVSNAFRGFQPAQAPVGQTVQGGQQASQQTDAGATGGNPSGVGQSGAQGNGAANRNDAAGNAGAQGNGTANRNDGAGNAGAQGNGAANRNDAAANAGAQGNSAANRNDGAGYAGAAGGGDTDASRPIFNAPVEDIYSFDGSGNSFARPDRGAAGSELIRILPTSNSDRLNDPDLPSAREVSNAVMADLGDTPNAKGASDMLWQWGQFLDHDITATAADKGNAAPIDVPKGDAHFDPFGTGTQTIDFTRSKAEVGPDGQLNQINDITAFIDGSNVYGSDQETADRLRSHDGGRMRVDEFNILPKEAHPSTEPAARGQTLYDAGDARNSEQPGLTSMHTLFVREHNRIADELSAENPGWSDEQLFQAARSQNIAQMQAITHNEFLPTLLGEDAIAEYNGYKPGVDPSISNAFATSGFRFGHSAIPSTIPMDTNGKPIHVATGGPPGHSGAAGAPGNAHGAPTTSTGGEPGKDGIGLRDAFFNPTIIEQNGIDPFLRGLTQNVHQALDHQINDDLRNFLFGPPGAGGMDLAAANIQRGRDHDLPGYNDAREALGLNRIESFDDPIFRDGVGDKLAQVYDHPDDVDMWVGGLTEKASGSAMVGELNLAIMVDQFTRLRDGDRLWYENTMTPEQVRAINDTSLADIIKRNSDVQDIDDTAFLAND